MVCRLSRRRKGALERIALLWMDRQAVGGSAPIRNRDRARVYAQTRGTLLDAVFFEPPVELSATEAEQARRLGLVALGLAESLLDQPALHGAEVHRFRRKRRRAIGRVVRCRPSQPVTGAIAVAVAGGERNRGPREMLPGDQAAITEQNGPLDRIPQLANVAGPGIGEQPLASIA